MNEPYIIPFGKFRGKTIEEVDGKELDGYCQWLIDNSAKKRVKLNGVALELVERVKSLHQPKAEGPLDAIPF
jgi:hypothetical protein